jgi:hypothetical protein
MIILALIALILRPILFTNLIRFNLVIEFALSYPVLSIEHGLLEKQAIHMLFAGIIELNFSIICCIIIVFSLLS